MKKITNDMLNEQLNSNGICDINFVELDLEQSELLASSLEKKTSFYHLNLHQSKLDYKLIFNTLAFNRSVTRFNLTECDLQQDELTELCNMIQKNTTFIHLCLSGTMYNDNAPQIFNALKYNTSINSLDIPNCINSRGLKLLKETLDYNTTLNSYKLLHETYAPFFMKQSIENSPYTNLIKTKTLENENYLNSFFQTVSKYTSNLNDKLIKKPWKNVSDELKEACKYSLLVSNAIFTTKSAEEGALNTMKNYIDDILFLFDMKAEIQPALRLVAPYVDNHTKHCLITTYDDPNYANLNNNNEVDFTGDNTEWL